MNRPQYKFSEVGSWFRNKFNAIVAQNLFEIGLNSPALPIFLPGLDVKTDRIAVHGWFPNWMYPACSREFHSAGTFTFVGANLKGLGREDWPAECTPSNGPQPIDRRARGARRAWESEPEVLRGADRGVMARSLSEQGELNKAELIGIPDRKLLRDRI
jgi:hypothetical protein